jgi:hypothetical protein
MDLVRLFNPRTEHWPDHFQLALDGELRGRTATGRATIKQLQMNSMSQRIARRRWMKWGIYPSPDQS